METSGQEAPKLDVDKSKAEDASDAKQSSSKEPETQAQAVKNDEPYVQPSGLFVPSGMKHPKTMVQHIMIERMATFVDEQMKEILEKSGQSSNADFDFLSLCDDLHPYYKHLLTCIRTGEYQPTESTNKKGSPSNENYDSCESEEDGNSCWHPILEMKKRSLSKDVPPPSTSKSSPLLVPKTKEKDSQEPQKDKVAPRKPPVVTGVLVKRPQDTLTPEDRKTIENFAKRIIKQGPIVEALVNWNDPRYAFLDYHHPFHSYYLQCKSQLKSGATTADAVEKSTNSHGPSRRKKTSHTGTNDAVPGSSYVKPLPTPDPGIPLEEYEILQKKIAALPAQLESRLKEIRRKSTAHRKLGEISREANPGRVSSSKPCSVSKESCLVSAAAQKIAEPAAKKEIVITAPASLNPATANYHAKTERKPINDSMHKPSTSHGRRVRSGFANSKGSKRNLGKCSGNGAIEMSIRDLGYHMKNVPQKKVLSFLEKMKSNIMNAQMRAHNEKNKTLNVDYERSPIFSPASERVNENQHNEILLRDEGTCCKQKTEIRPRSSSFSETSTAVCIVDPQNAASEVMNNVTCQAHPKIDSHSPQISQSELPVQTENTHIAEALSRSRVENLGESSDVNLENMQTKKLPLAKHSRKINDSGVLSYSPFSLSSKKKRSKRKISKAQGNIHVSKSELAVSCDITSGTSCNHEKGRKRMLSISSKEICDSDGNSSSSSLSKKRHSKSRHTKKREERHRRKKEHPKCSQSKKFKKHGH